MGGLGLNGFCWNGLAKWLCLNGFGRLDGVGRVMLVEWFLVPQLPVEQHPWFCCVRNCRDGVRTGGVPSIGAPVEAPNAPAG
jgi:hypothetical protein